MATLPSTASLTGASTTNAQQKTNFSDLRTFLSDLLGTDSGNKVAARAALGVGAADPGSSLVANGYQKFASGLILQWGTAATPSNGATTVGFNIPFPNQVLYATANVPSVTFSTFSANVGNITPTQMNVLTSSSNGSTQAAFYWFALGR